MWEVQRTFTLYGLLSVGGLSSWILWHEQHCLLISDIVWGGCPWLESARDQETKYGE